MRENGVSEYVFITLSICCRFDINPFMHFNTRTFRESILCCICYAAVARRLWSHQQRRQSVSHTTVATEAPAPATCVSYKLI